MNKTIWTCWFQGRDAAPPLVQRCMESWEEKNPGWTVKCLDATTVERYVDLRRHIDLSTQAVTAASLSDVLRILLLHEFGGVWVDATLFCNESLDEWLPQWMSEGFFAFAKPAPDRLLASWFLAAQSGSLLVKKWCRKVIAYWNSRPAADEYFWFHRCFGELCDQDPEAAAIWSRVPKISADGPHSAQAAGRTYRPLEDVWHLVDWKSPVYKLTYRYDPELVQSGDLLDTFVARPARFEPAIAIPPEPAKVPPKQFASLAVSTENLGDHIQILAGLRLLGAMGRAPEIFIDRDHEIRSASAIAEIAGSIGILLNGWFKTNGNEWPPHPNLDPLFHGFHIRLFQCPELVAPESLDYFRRHGPIGCRDPHTEQLLQSHGVDAFLTNCLTLTLPRRIEEPAGDVFVVSRDKRICAFLPESLGPYEFVSHYSETRDFSANMTSASSLLDRYRTRARLIVTTMLHCALPAIAMGIPVVVFYPINEGDAHTSDQERFSALKGLVSIHKLDDLTEVNWNPPPIDVASLKLAMLETFYGAAARRWGQMKHHPVGPIASSDVLPPS